MDQLTTFLELPLDRDPYKTRVRESKKPPIRILITEAGTKAAYHLIYKICSGQVFGHDQSVILHLVNAKGTIDHKAMLLDLDECGFPLLADSVVSAEPRKSYGDVDIIVLMAMFEELEGHSLCESFFFQLIKARVVAKNMCMYAKPNSKLIVCSPSTKGVTALLTFLKVFEPRLCFKNVTGVVGLDETIAKSHIAAQLKTTTDKIKNLVIWGTTFPDVRNATVLMYPPEDKADLEKKEIPLLQALQNHAWVYSDLIKVLYKRVLVSELATYGGAVASAVAKHLKVLFQGSDCVEEIASMGVIVPPEEPFGLTKGLGFSLPVTTSNGDVTIREDVSFETATHLMNIRCVYNFCFHEFMRSIAKVVNYITEFEEKENKEFLWYQHSSFLKQINLEPIYFKYLITPRIHDQNISISKDEVIKSVTWNEVDTTLRSSEKINNKSLLRFNLEESDSTNNI